MTTGARNIWAAGLMAAAVMIAGCQTGSTVGGATEATAGERGEALPRLTPTPQPLIADLPVPAGFKFVDDLSRDYQTGRFRFVDHTYRGSATKFQTERFYSRYMPENGWELRGKQLVRGLILMRYAKGSEFCEVRIDSSTGLFGSTATVSLNVQTLNPTPTGESGG